VIAAHTAGGKETDADTAHDAANGVNTKGVERIVVSKVVLELGAKVANDAGEEARPEGSVLVHEAGAGGNADEASDDARGHA